MIRENEEVALLLDDLEERTQKSLLAFQNELAGLRAGRANVHILDGITVDYYGTPTPLNQVANITIPEARILCVSVWDISIMKKVEKSIMDANVGITPTNDGKVIRLVFPEPNEERRKSLAKEVKTIAEKCKISIRNVRRDIMEEIKKMKKASTISEDMQMTLEKDVDKLVVEKIAEVDKIAQAKEVEIMKV